MRRLVFFSMSRANAIQYLLEVEQVSEVEEGNLQFVLGRGLFLKGAELPR